MAGARNIFSDIDGWKPISRELLSISKPDHIVLTQRALESIGGISSMQADPLLSSTNALKNEKVHVFQGMRLLGFGLQTLDVALQLKDAIE
jgi:iron complex transport system substrate-binding protein